MRWRRPAESKPWKDYRPIFLTDKRIDDGVAFYRENRALLERVGKEYGVPPEIIVAIVGVETNYGRITGKYRVHRCALDARVPLSAARAFFRGELKQLFMLGDSHLAYPIDELRGSYAGAMGWGQFMPTSIAQWAKDEDGDGRIDLWNSLPDITRERRQLFRRARLANGRPGRRARAAGRRCARAASRGSEPVYPVQQMEAWGYAPLEPRRAEAALDAAHARRRSRPGVLAHVQEFLRDHALQQESAVLDGGVRSSRRRSPTASSNRRQWTKWPAPMRWRSRCC